MTTRRIEKINHAIRERVSELLQREVKDPRLGRFITVTRVSTSQDLRYAKIFVSIMSSDTERQETFKCLVDAQGFFRHELAETLKLRCTPELIFCIDNSIAQGAHVLELFKQIGEQTNTGSTDANNG